jgi:hypothetical protein
MPSTNQSRSWWLPLLFAFVVGTLIGYFLHKPASPPKQTNKAYFNILPGGVQAAPNTGDKVEWLLAGKKADDVHIHFLGDSPCKESGDGHTCTIAEAAQGQFIYFCSDKADPSDPSAKILCQDPGIEPNSGGDGKLELPGTNVVYAAQRPKAPEPVATPTATNIPPTNLTVVCKNNTVQVLNPSTTPPNTDPPNVRVGGLIQWNSTLSPTIKIDSNKCEGSPGGSPPYCTVKEAGDISYTIDVSKDKCSNPAPAPFHINVVTPLKGCPF